MWQGSEVEEQRSVNTEQSELSMTSIERRHLSDKLQDLKDKKVYMDQLLTDLHDLRRQQHPHLNNGELIGFLLSPYSILSV